MQVPYGQCAFPGLGTLVLSSALGISDLGREVLDHAVKRRLLRDEFHAFAGLKPRLAVPENHLLPHLCVCAQ